MIEAVENHMPEVVVIDEIGTEAEAMAARTIAERGVQLIGTAHGQTLENLLMNPTLSDLVGGISSVTLSDEEARRRGTRKTVLERKAPPTFDVLIEIQRSRPALDLRRTSATRRRAAARLPAAARSASAHAGGGGRRCVQEADPARAVIETQPPHAAARRRDALRRGERRRSADEDRDKPLMIFPYGVSRNKIERAIQNLRVNASIARKWDDADVVLTLKTLERKESEKLKSIAAENVPIYSIKTNTTTQIHAALKDIFACPRSTSKRSRCAKPRKPIYKVLLDNTRSNSRRRVVRAPPAAPARRAARVQSRSTASNPTGACCTIAGRLRWRRRTEESPRSRISRAAGARPFHQHRRNRGQRQIDAARGPRRAPARAPASTCSQTREPGGTALGERVRALFLDPAGNRSRAEALFSTHRARNSCARDRARARAGAWVVSDRFSTSTLAYQGYGRGLELDGLRSLAAFATGGLEPDLVLLVDIPPEVSRERAFADARAPTIASSAKTMRSTPASAKATWSWPPPTRACARSTARSRPDELARAAWSHVEGLIAS
jgi:hypothetical protein